MHDMNNTRKEIAARLGFAAGNGAKVSFERYEIGDAFKFEDKIYVINSHANEINAVLSSADSNAKKALSLADFAHSKWLQFEGKAKSSRPGAKASFGRAEDVYRLLETTPSSYNNAKKLDALATEAMRLADITPAGKDVSLHELAEMVGQDLEGDRSRASRPGAKAEFAIDARDELMMRTWIKNNYPKADNAAFNKMLAKMTKEYAKDPKGYTYGGGFRAVAKAAGFSQDGAKVTMTRDQTEEQKAGLKIMSAADPAVGAKIATLIKEGKPQDQAVAIALDMKRRGEI